MQHEYYNRKRRFCQVEKRGFLKMGRKIARGFGVAVCVLLFVLCVFMVIVSAVFGAEGPVDMFGYNLYLCEESSFEGVASGSAVVVEQCEPYDLMVGTLILYKTGAEGEELHTLGYTETVTHKDGVYSLTVSDANNEKILISEGDFIGRAGWSSPALGRVISFSTSPWGIIVMAVLPCLALIIFSVVKGIVDDQPLPEVVPQVKNAERDEPKPTSGISVKADGNAEYSRSANNKAAKTADSVLFTYGAKRSPATMKSDTPPARPAAPKPAATKQVATDRPAEKPAATGGVPSSVAARKYIDSATAAKQAKPAAADTIPTRSKVSGATAEIPQIPRKTKNDAFFTQSSAPQIGRQRPSAQTRAVIDLEDALATANDKRESARKPSDTSAKRSADILAAKRRDELMTEDDDTRDKNRYDVDDILAGLDRRHR